ncbi:MAG: methyltransferase domain-containing protein, partial [Ignavibacteriaceae bacterium]|nr:methyltransferase domain-containing protein [Ignavibacteriaceae bacterium]
IEEFIKSNKQSYDLVIATEVVEHLSNISDFLEETKKILAPSGQILLTTPNKDFTKKDFVWLTDLPPVHVTWLGKKSFLVLGSQKQFEVSFISFRNYYPKNENRFIKYLRFQRDIDPKPVFNDNGIPIIKSEETRFPFLRNIIKWLVHGFPPLRLFSNILFNYLYPDDNTLGVILKPIETNRRLD